MTGWVRSTHCAAGDCVEWQACTWRGQPMVRGRRVRNGRPEAAFTSLTRDEWNAFVAGIRAGDFDQLTQEGTTP